MAVLGAGNSGLAMAAHLALEGYRVRLWNRREEAIEALIRSPVIRADGIINCIARLELASSSIQEVIGGTSTILVTTPADAHGDIAQLIAPYAADDQLIVLNPGRTFGALEFTARLQEGGCLSGPLVVETQTTIYTCRKSAPGRVAIMAMKHDVLYSAIDHRINENIKNRFPAPLSPYLSPAESMIETSLGNVGMILHCAPILLNSGWIESTQGRFKYYSEGITPSIARFLERLDRERLLVAERLGHPIESTADWLRRSYTVAGSDLYESIQNNGAYHTIEAPTNLQHRYIREDVSCGLVPLEAVGRCLGLPMPLCGLVIDLADALLETDLRQRGRSSINLERWRNVMSR